VLRVCKLLRPNISIKLPSPAAAKALAEHHDTELKVDTSYLKSWPKFEKYGGEWEYSLGYFNTSAKIASGKDVSKHIFRTKFRPIDRLLRKYKIFDEKVRIP